MKKVLLLISLFFCFHMLFAQQNEEGKIKYCFQTHYSFEKKVTAEQQLLRILDEFYIFPTVDKRAKIRLLGNMECLQCDSDKNDIQDSILGVFKIKKIVRKKNNYSKAMGKLIKQSIFLIDVENIDSTEEYPQYIRLLSVDRADGKGKKIKVGQDYEMTIYSFFKKDCCRPTIRNGETIYRIRQPNQSVECFFFDNIWVVHMDISGYNLFETPNLIGLHYYVKAE